MASGRQGTKPQQAAAAADQDFDPKYEWQEYANNFVLRLHLSGFRKEDFRVQVDCAGRLTVRGQRAGGGKHSRFNKVFQLPATSNLDDITGRFDGGVLTLTVPKRPATTIQEIKNQQPAKQQQQADDAKPKDEPKKPQAEMTTAKEPKDDAKPKEDAKKPPAEQQQQQVDAAKRGGGGKLEQEQPTRPAAPPAAVGKEEAQPKAEAAAPPAADEKKQAAAPIRPPPQADAESKAVDPESLAAVTAKRRAEEERAKAAAAAGEAEPQRPRREFMERFQAELDGLDAPEWAESLVETVKKNREVIAAAVAAFSLGVFVSSRLFSRN